MSREARELRLQHQELFIKVARLQAELEAGLQETEVRYNRVQYMLTEVDGASNAAFILAMENNKRKANETAILMRGLLDFLRNSALFAKQTDEDLGNKIYSGGGTP